MERPRESICMWCTLPIRYGTSPNSGLWYHAEGPRRGDWRCTALDGRGRPQTATPPTDYYRTGGRHG
jgi:hypothetical protein